MEQNDISRWIDENLSGVAFRRTWGEASWFFNPGNLHPHGAYFLTMKDANGPNDRASALDREGVWRLNIGVPRETFEALFGPPPKRPAKGEAIEGPWLFTAPNLLTPHPVYGWMSWVSILNPNRRSFERLKPMIVEAHGKARKTFEARLRKAAAGKVA